MGSTPGAHAYSAAAIARRLGRINADPVSCLKPTCSCSFATSTRLGPFGSHVLVIVRSADRNLVSVVRRNTAALPAAIYLRYPLFLVAFRRGDIPAEARLALDPR